MSCGFHEAVSDNNRTVACMTWLGSHVVRAMSVDISEIMDLKNCYFHIGIFELLNIRYFLCEKLILNLNTKARMLFI